LVDLFESYDDARTCERQIYQPNTTYTEDSYTFGLYNKISLGRNTSLLFK